MILKFKRILEENGDSEQAEKMSAYMQNKFLFAGIPKQRLKELYSLCTVTLQQKPEQLFVRMIDRKRLT